MNFLYLAKVLLAILNRYDLFCLQSPEYIDKDGTHIRDYLMTYNMGVPLFARKSVSSLGELSFSATFTDKDYYHKEHMYTITLDYNGHCFVNGKYNDNTDRFDEEDEEILVGIMECLNNFIIIESVK